MKKTLYLLAIVFAAFVTNIVADSDISINPIAPVFKPVDVGNVSDPFPFTVSNRGSTDLVLDTLSFTGTNAAEFATQNDNCSGQTVLTGSDCSLEVVFSPVSAGLKYANLQISSNDPDTPVLNAVVTNYESLAEESRRRLPPVLYALDIPETMTAGAEYTLTWSILGYHDSYKTIAAFFNCDGQSDCGANYFSASRFEDTGKLAPVTTEAGSWQYEGVTSTLYHYTYNFTAPSFDQSTDVVIRFYQLCVDDEEAGASSLSLLVPGNLSDRYYDSSGRRVLKTIVP